MTAVTQYGDISPRVAAYAVSQLLKRGLPYLVLEKFGQTYPIPNNSTKVAKFRRYFLAGATGGAGDGNPANAFNTPLAITPLVEGVTPTGKKLANQDYTVTLQQYGDYLTITDVVMDTAEDQVLQQATEALGESAAQTIETIRFNVLKAGVNVFYANGSVRTSVNTAISTAMQRKVTTALTRQNAKRITQIVKSTPDFRTEPVEAAFIGLVHPDLESDIRNMTGFVPTKQYGTVTPWENEIGSVETVRYLQSTIFAPWADAGGSAGAMRSTSGTSADVYPVLYLGRDAYGIVPLKGKDSLVPMVVNPKPAAGDPLAQRGTVGWKAMTAAVILNDCWMARLEVAATA
ncbi:N4-gp56 family major capsid protein [Burkholderia sp. JKS000303]|uniref:N4-gp56 family major capsid protein n=1 Tax=Burkholderia sp. JKS000303 TaxID=1938747 RepID=UPI000BF2DB4C|nr:N4-gp56 family major capsid protein [Burkholderia sp. JKS000303]PFH12850.1 N4-gp56 family major capsid protein [Burkholderia sp. JKS000303]